MHLEIERDWSNDYDKLWVTLQSIACICVFANRYRRIGKSPKKLIAIVSITPQAKYESAWSVSFVSKTGRSISLEHQGSGKESFFQTCKLMDLRWPDVLGDN